VDATFHWGCKHCTYIWKEISYMVKVRSDENVCKDNMLRLFSEVIE